MTSRILLFGAKGQVGHELARSLTVSGELICVDRKSGDLCDPDALKSVITDQNPDLIVNAAAHTQVDKAETEPDLAHRINAAAVGEMADLARKQGIPLIHFSTDYVFSGENGGTPYREDDPTDPLNVYGESKLAGEALIRQSGTRHLIFRTEWVYSARRHNFLLTMMRLAKEKDELRVVSDQFGAPTWAALPAQVIASILARYPLKEGGWPEAFDGVYHLTASGETSWHGFASEIVKTMKAANADRPWPDVHPIPSSDYPTPAKRPANSRLDTTKIQSTFNLQIPDWRRHVSLVMSELL